MKTVTSRASAHLVALRQKHYDLELKINEALHTRKPDNVVTDLKKQKLKIKEEIDNLQRQTTK